MKRIQAAILTIGDELLIGQVIDTNSAFIAQELNKIGVVVKQRLAVGDVYEDIWQALNNLSSIADIILITGGLGPTADDITKPLLCKYFNGHMVLDEATLAHVHYLFEQVYRRPGPLLERNRKQAEVPDVCTVLKNEKGTAPGMLFEKAGKIFVAMPGVPFEMKWITTHHVIPIIQSKFNTGFIEHRTLLTQGMGESSIAELLKDWEPQLPTHIKLAYLPNHGMVRLRLTGYGADLDALNQSLDAFFAELQDFVKANLITTQDEPMEQVVAKLLKQYGKTLSTAESCTGGQIAGTFTQHAGASSFFTGSVVCYDDRIKTEQLGVSEEILQTVGAVSKETVERMASQVRTKLKTDYSIAVSGIMGPTGATAEKPVGLVWVAVASEHTTWSHAYQFGFDRPRNIQFTIINAINMLRKLIIQELCR